MGFAVPDDSGAFVEGLVAFEDKARWCVLGMILGGNKQRTVILPYMRMVDFGKQHAGLCLVMGSIGHSEL